MNRLAESQFGCCREDYIWFERLSSGNPLHIYIWDAWCIYIQYIYTDWNGPDCIYCDLRYIMRDTNELNVAARLGNVNALQTVKKPWNGWPGCERAYRGWVCDPRRFDEIELKAAWGSGVVWWSVWGSPRMMGAQDIRICVWEHVRFCVFVCVLQDTCRTG